MKYWQARKLSSRKFKRLCGVKYQTFRLMVRLVKAQQKQKRKLGRPTKLIPEDQILVTLQYWREYRSYFHLSKDWKIAESTVCRLVRKVENILIKSRKFSLPGKKKLLDFPRSENLIVMDVMESPIEKPCRGQKRFYSGKQGEHTLKTQVIIEQKSQKIMCLGHGKGRIHDFQLFKNSGVRFGELLKVIADKGYQGIAKIHPLSETQEQETKGRKINASPEEI